MLLNHHLSSSISGAGPRLIHAPSGLRLYNQYLLFSLSCPPLLLSSLLPFIHFSLVHGDLPGPGTIASPLRGLPPNTVVPANETKVLLPSTSPLQKLLSQENSRHEAPGAVFVLMLVPDKVWSSEVECCTQCSSTFSNLDCFHNALS